MRFISLVKDSIYSPAFYRGLPQKPHSYSFKYFYVLVSGLSIALVVLFAFRVVPPIQGFLRSLSPALVAHFPDDLVVTIEDGVAMSNTEGKVALPFPPAWRESGRFGDFGAQDLPTNLLVIDTAGESAVEDFAAYDTLVLLTKDRLVYTESPGKVTTQALMGVSKVRIDKSFIIKLADGADTLAKFIPVLMIFAGFVLFLFLYSFELLLLLIWALFIMLIARQKKLMLTYKKSYQVGMHAITFGLILYTLSFFFPIPWFRGVFIISILFITWLNLESPAVEEPVVVPEARPQGAA